MLPREFESHPFRQMILILLTFCHILPTYPQPYPMLGCVALTLVGAPGLSEDVSRL
jgi:hypothetical protein